MARLLGIDIAESAVRVALLRSAYRRVVVEALVEVPTAHTTVSEAIASAVSGLRFDGSAVGMPGESVFYRRVELPATAQREIEAVLGFELEATVPFELEDAVHDHVQLRRSSAGGAIEVFAAIAQLPEVRARIELVKGALKREPEMVVPGSVAFAALTAVVPELEQGLVRPPGAPPPGAEGHAQVELVPSASAPVAVLDLGELRSEVLVLMAGEPAFARTLSRGTQGLPQSARALGQDLRQTFAAFRAQGGDAPSVLYLAGAGASIHGAETFLSGMLGMTVRILPSMKLELAPPPKPGNSQQGYPGVTADRSGELPRFAKAIALALGLESRGRTLDLRQGPLEIARSYAYFREKLPLLSGLAAVIAVSFGFSVVAELRALSTERAALDERMRAATREVLGEEVMDVDRAIELLEKGPLSEDDPLPKVDAFDLMVQLSKAVPTDVVHDIADFDVARGHAIIQGVVPSGTDAQGTADKIATSLRENPCFRDVRVQKTVQFGQDKQKYILELDLRCEDKVAAKKKPTDAPSKPKAEEGDEP
jgi:general secretion pathway protein L